MPHVELPQAEFKVVMLGDTNVGKTSLVLRFAEGYYRDASRSQTVGAFFITKRVQTCNGITCKVQIWDTAGQKQYRKMAPMYYKTAAAAVLCYDVSNPSSFEVVKEWVEELKPTIAAGNIVIAIVATKSDLLDEPTASTLVPSHLAKNVADQVGRSGAIFMQTSARNDENIDLLFQRIAEEVLHVREQAVALRNSHYVGGNNAFSGVNGGGNDMHLTSGYGLDDLNDDKDIIPVTPGASIDELGHIVKKYPRSNSPVSGGKGYNMNETGGAVGGSSPGIGVGDHIRNKQSPVLMKKRKSVDHRSSIVSTRGNGGGEEEHVDFEESMPMSSCMSMMECSSKNEDNPSCTIS